MLLVVVAHHRARVQFPYASDNANRIWPTIEQIAEKHEAVLALLELHELQQLVELFEAAVDIPDSKYADPARKDGALVNLRCEAHGSIL
jgi:hypothetical protein